VAQHRRRGVNGNKAAISPTRIAAPPVDTIRQRWCDVDEPVREKAVGHRSQLNAGISPPPIGVWKMSTSPAPV
jgi:hypothetical protein